MVFLGNFLGITVTPNISGAHIICNYSVDRLSLAAYAIRKMGLIVTANDNDNELTTARDLSFLVTSTVLCQMAFLKCFFFAKKGSRVSFMKI